MYEYNIGGKTGFTEKARRTLVTASKKDEKTCIVVTLNDGNDFEDHKALCESVFNEYERVLLVDKESLNLDIENPEKYYIENDLYALLKEEEKENIKIEYKMNNTENGEAGVVEVYLNGELLTKTKIYQKERTPATKENFFTRFFRWLFGW